MTFEVPGKPQPKQRARTVNGHSYTPEKTVLYENWVKACYNGQKFEGQLRAKIECFFPIPKSYPRKKTERCKANLERPTGKNLGDCDNLAKSILDSLNGIAYYDDSQIVELNVSKRWGDPKAIVILEEL